MISPHDTSPPAGRNKPDRRRELRVNATVPTVRYIVLTAKLGIYPVGSYF